MKGKRHMNVVKLIALLIMLISYTLVFTGCNTVHGLGKDIEQLGHAMKQSSEK